MQIRFAPRGDEDDGCALITMQRQSPIKDEDAVLSATFGVARSGRRQGRDNGTKIAGLQAGTAHKCPIHMGNRENLGGV